MLALADIHIYITHNITELLLKLQLNAPNPKQTNTPTFTASCLEASVNIYEVYECQNNSPLL